ncbi:MAG TPA: hypothetical protein VGO43_08005 [Pyrinomonadaceae bacterium]|jgi:hypothetical protein|nr:hypothetical protein [Pyrinomonadaceae bacterium]
MTDHAPAPPKAVSSPFSTGSGGSNFENKVQTVFVIMMLAGGTAPALPPWPIIQIKLQGRYAGYHTDDFIVFAKEPDGSRTSKLLAQIKHVAAITESDVAFTETIAAAWSDFNDTSIFDAAFDQLALITGPLSASDSESARTILEWARTSESHEEFFLKVDLGKFSSDEKRRKLDVFRQQLKKANRDTDVGDERLFHFLRRFHLIGFDLDTASSSSLALAYSLLSVFRPQRAAESFGVIAQEVARYNQNAGTITPEELPLHIRDVFVIQPRLTIPEKFVESGIKEPLSGDPAEAVLLASLLGGWNENMPGDNEVIEELVGAK